MALDIQYKSFGIGYQLDAPRTRYLEEAIAAVLAGADVPVAATTAPGCVLSRVRFDDDADKRGGAVAAEYRAKGANVLRGHGLGVQRVQAAGRAAGLGAAIRARCTRQLTPF